MHYCSIRYVLQQRSHSPQLLGTWSESKKISEIPIHVMDWFGLTCPPIFCTSNYTPAEVGGKSLRKGQEVAKILPTWNLAKFGRFAARQQEEAPGSPCESLVADVFGWHAAPRCQMTSTIICGGSTPRGTSACSTRSTACGGAAFFFGCQESQCRYLDLKTHFFSIFLFFKSRQCFWQSFFFSPLLLEAVRIFWPNMFPWSFTGDSSLCCWLSKYWYWAHRWMPRDVCVSLGCFSAATQF